LDARDCERQSLDASEATSGAPDSDQYVFTHYCTLEAMRTRGFSAGALMKEFEHSIECQVGRDFAWKFWTNVDNWSAVDPAVEWAKLEGPFITGTIGRVKPRGADPNEWKLAEVEEGKRAVIEMALPGATVKFHWNFADMTGGGARITQKVTLEGERAAEYEEGMKPMEKGIPSGMEKLIDSMVKAARG
jgi:polyketide cyclase/dehydrase/lipid transport protein